MKSIRTLIKRICDTQLVKRIFLIYILCEILPLILLFLLMRYSTVRILSSDITQAEASKLSGIQNVVGVVIVLGGGLISILLIGYFTGRFVKRLNEFKNRLHQTAAGDFQIVENSEVHDEISELYEDLHIMIDSIQKLITTVYEEQVQKEKLNSRQKDVEFKMLASQINPHFLYNTLETIRMKARCSGEIEIEELVKMLAKIMRRNIQVGDKLVTLKSELELVEYYLKIQQYRFGERIHYKVEVRCNIEYLKIMPLIIQPVVENAFVHGLETKEGEGQIHIIVENTDHLVIRVMDDGIGMSREKLAEIKENLNDFRKLNRSNIGLSNVNQRIKLLYGLDYGIKVESEENKGTVITIELPEDIRQ
jgi:two-component system, sensor histidine kinase YesM